MKIRLLIAIVVVSAIMGCETVRMENTSHIEGIRYHVQAIDSEPFLKGQAVENRQILENSYRDERTYYPSKNKSATSENLRPETGLALSGGGMRSAAFSIGVMSGLAKKKDVFNSIDIISAVSGGSYALSWYYMQQYYMMQTLCKTKHCKADEKCEDRPAYKECLAKLCEDDPACKDCLARLPAQLLDPKGPFQKHLAKHGNLTAPYRVFAWSIIDGLLIPVNLFSNLLFGWRTNTTISRGWYENQIEQTFHRIPEGVCSGSTQGIDDKPATFRELKNFVKDKGLPFFIINATVQIDDDKFHHSSKMSKSVFEFTPLQIGSSGVLFANWKEKVDKIAPLESVAVASAPGEYALVWSAPEKPALLEADPMSVVRGVSISGAAVDSNALAPGPAQKVILSMFNQDLGYFMPNYNHTDEERAKHLFFPFPFYYKHYYIKDAHGLKLYLTDGGHSENLGVFSLVRRLPRRIIIVDAEHDYDIERDRDGDRDSDRKKYRHTDKYYLFEAYRKLKASLKDEMGVEFIVPCIGKSEEEKCTENCGDTCLMRSSPYKTKESCLNGYIGYFPYNSKEGVSSENACIEVKYIKLSIDMEKLCRDYKDILSMEKLCQDYKDIPSMEKLCRDSEDIEAVPCPKYPITVSKYVKKRVEWNKLGNPHCSIFGLACDFPQESTSDQHYEEDQFEAYRDLGKWIVENQCDFKTRMCR